MKQLSSLIYTFFCVATAMIGYTIHGSIFWSIIDFFLTPLVWVKWLVFHEINITIIKNTFDFLTK